MRTSPPHQTDETPRVELTLEGSLRHLEAEIRFRYSQPDVANPAKEGEALARLLEFGFAGDKGKAVLRGEDRTEERVLAESMRTSQTDRG